jgi:glutamine cyclotransferase
MSYEGRIHLKQEDGKTNLVYLNELELVVENGKEYIWAHLYRLNWIVKVDTSTGLVMKRINLGVLQDIAVLTPSESYPSMYNYGDQDQALNGLAYDPVKDFFYVTGKKWGYIFKIRIY